MFIIHFCRFFFRDFVLEPVRGFQRSVQEMDASYLVDGVARGTLSLTRHTVGGFADSAAMIAETFSKNMAVLTLDRKYAQKRDRGEIFREYDDINVASGLGSGVQKLVNGFLEGVTGVVRAPIRGAEKHGLEGFAKGIGKGLLGLLVKPIIGISDGFSDVMIGVKGSVEGGSAGSNQLTQIRPRRALYGREKAIRSFHFPDAAASALMLRTRLAGEPYLNHLDLGDRVILLSCKRAVMLGREGEELLVLKLKNVESVEIRGVTHENGRIEWGVVILLNTPNQAGSEVEVIVCKEKSQAEQLCMQLNHGREVASNA
jgi:Vacuolar-sorting-associated 13 protein C-terminal/Autophagy-related protein C terminal domain